MSYNERMKVYQRRTLVKREKWPLIDGWYWCPQSVLNDRIDKEITRMRLTQTLVTAKQMGWPLSWKFCERIVTGRLAHACDDGEIRAPWVETYLRNDNVTTIYGKCRTCNIPLSDGIKAIILLEYVV